MFENHFKKCEFLLSKFLNFDSKISLLIKEYNFCKQNLIIIRFIFKRYINLIDKKIKELKYQNNVDNKILLKSQLKLFFQEKQI